MTPLHAVIIALRNAFNCIIPFLRHFNIVSFWANKCAIEVEKDACHCVIYEVTV